MQPENRDKFIKAFNAAPSASSSSSSGGGEGGAAFRVFLLSTRAGSVGINLTSARRLVVIDTPFNPVHNAQVGGRGGLQCGRVLDVCVDLGVAGDWLGWVSWSSN